MAVPLLRVDLGRGVGAAFTDRRGGVSAPPYDELNLAYHVDDEWDRAYANRSLLAKAVGFPEDRLCFVHQVHADTVLTVVDHQVGTVKTRVGRRDGDAMVTTVAAAPLVIMVADCVPILMADPVAGVVAAVHAGRKGVVAGIVGKAVAAMRAAGALDVRGGNRSLGMCRVLRGARSHGR